MRERWLLQGTPTGADDEDEGRRKQVEQDELHAKKLEESIQRYTRSVCLNSYSVHLFHSFTKASSFWTLANAAVVIAVPKVGTFWAYSSFNSFLE